MIEDRLTRRELLGGTALLVSSGAGCTGDPEEEKNLKDSDGDGMIDSKDYAPKDSAVQSKSDLQTTSTMVEKKPDSDTTSTSTTTTTTTSTTTTTTSTTTTTTEKVNKIHVNDEYWENQSRIKWYSSEEIAVLVQGDTLKTEYDSAKVYVSAHAYPRGEMYYESTSEVFSQSDGSYEATVSVDLPDGLLYEQIHYLVGLIPADETIESANTDDFVTIMETDPIVYKPGGEIEKSPHPEALQDDSGEGYTRNATEGAYALEVTGLTNGQKWSVELFTFKSAYIQAINRSRGRSREEYVTYELTNGSAGLLADILSDQANQLDFSDRQAVEFVIDFVQRLPYVPDDVSTGFDDYTKFIMETMTEMGGDCEDSSILLASILSAEPFNYDVVLIQPPGHMAVGLWQSEPQGYYYESDGRKYAYIETTGEGWSIGDCPEEYQGESAYVYQV